MSKECPIKSMIDLGKGEWSLAVAELDGVPSLLIQRLKSPCEIGTVVEEENKLDDHNVAIRFHSKDGIHQIQKFIKYVDEYMDQKEQNKNDN